MSAEHAGPTPFWATVRALLHASRLRARGRSSRNRELTSRKGGEAGTQGFLVFVGFVICALLHGFTSMLVTGFVEVADDLEIEASGRLDVAPEVLRLLDRIEERKRDPDPARRPTPAEVRSEVRGAMNNDHSARNRGEEPGEWRSRLVEHYELHGRAGFVEAGSAWGFARRGHLPAAAGLLGSLVVLGWFVMLALQGEGLELDLQRRRNPMWEWLLSHPVDPRAVFLAEMLAPFRANPFFATAPAFWIGLFGFAYADPAIGLVAGLAAGVPFGIAGACVGKALEVVAFLRLPVRSRGAVLGILAWLGQALYVAMIFLAFSSGGLIAVTRFVARRLPGVSLDVMGTLLGLGSGSPLAGVAACVVVATVLTAIAVTVSARATRRGLAGGFGDAVDRPLVARPAVSRVLRDPLHRKELLWLWRDRGALVQVFLVPITIASLQVFQFRGLLVHATRGWHLLSGASVLFGTYFLSILGPRSLLSEGAALWIPLTWPRGLEDLLRGKARLWWVVSCGLVLPLLLVAAVRFPADAPKVALVAVLWVAFAGSVAQKSVTLVRHVSDSGEAEPVSKGLQWVASLGTFTFAIGIFTQRWNLMFAGMVFSWMITAALWQNLRARLPFLFDSWSETLAPPPTVLHGMVAIALAQEAMAVGIGIFGAFLEGGALWIAVSVVYGLVAIVAALVLAGWLRGRGVEPMTLWRWAGEPVAWRTLERGVAAGLALGVVLGFAGAGYQDVVRWLGREGYLTVAPVVMSAEARWWFALVAVGFAPVGEEYLFRGLVFRSLERERGYRWALVASACFFAIYHPPLAWIPVAAVGAVSAVLFRRSGHLLPSVLLHAAYNAVVVWRT